MGLKTDYKDSMYDGQRRYRLIPNEDGTYSIPDATVYTQQGDKFGANDINATNKRINEHEAVKYVTFKAADWSTAAPYTQTVSMPDMIATDKPIVSQSLPDGLTPAAEEQQEKAYNCVTKVVSGNGSLTAICRKKKPASDFQIQTKGR